MASAMKTGTYFQCTKCGAIHYIDYPYNTEELYSTLWCEECEDESNHLCVGNNILSYYESYDPHLDERFFIYD